MHKNELVQSLPYVEARDRICEIYQLGKQSRKPVVENHGKPVVENHGLDSHDGIEVSK